VLTRTELAGYAGSLLEALRSRVPNLRVEPGRAGRCPLVTLRGQRTLHAVQDVRIYIDRAEQPDTCTLEQVRAIEVERVEVYAGGQTNRPPYRSSPNGLIIIFLREA
jgi:hypothetical protein